MPASYSIDQQQGCVLSRASGTVVDQDLLGHREQMRVDAAFREDLNQLWDFRGIEGLHASTIAIKDLATDSPFSEASRRAIVVDSALAYGLARMFLAYADETNPSCRIFWDRAEAELWLGLSIR